MVDLSEDQLVGAMICLWCDEPSMTYVEENAKEQITAFAAANTDLFFGSSGTEGGFVNSEGNAITKLDLTMDAAQTVSVTGMEEGASLSASVDDEDVITAEVNGSSIVFNFSHRAGFKKLKRRLGRYNILYIASVYYFVHFLRIDF